ncbi:hypothetical protein [Mesorhizobium sp. CA12]|uniref:hypothetical protein n=1 Tax=Mesorhizobium sp. CA12 TaxID=2876644 RepID=UPI001CCE5B60|nr:hypothetical protein [Mesorhizobium sp. CA12]MBZ9859726.1 hypothetical protein [Mesorhizobium sp. CA12]
METIQLSLNPRDRLELSTTIENLINMLDALEPDPDLEPSVGWAENAGKGITEGQNLDDRESNVAGDGHYIPGRYGSGSELELDNSDYEDGTDAESGNWVEHCSQGADEYRRRYWRGAGL